MRAVARPRKCSGHPPRRDKNLQHLADALQAHPDEPLHVIWEYSWDGATGALMSEFMALGNHRKSIRAEIAEVSDRVRQVELDALRTNRELAHGNLSPDALVVLISAIPKFLNLENRRPDGTPRTSRRRRTVSRLGGAAGNRTRHENRADLRNAGSNNAELRETTRKCLGICERC